MIGFLARRGVIAIFVVFAISVICFVLSHVAIDPATGIAGDSATDEDIAAVRAQYGFDRPLFAQYWDYLASVARGDLGVSYLSGRPVSELLIERFPATGLLAVLSILFALAIAIPLGTLIVFW
ncbi:MAG: ABC transporter permease, partial [Pseudomonadota bacterium]